MTPGIYHLVIYLPSDMIIEIGKLGQFQFKTGYYVYTGSAMRGLESRITRHQRKQKRFHWHIDYLLQYGHIIDIIKHITTERLECHFNEKIMSMPFCQIPVKGFGSSDCKCITHLFFFDKKPEVLNN
jgi:Uri superfamily endonuclease